MRAPMLITVLVLYIVAMPVSVQARAVPQVGFLGSVQRADYDATKDPFKVWFFDGLQALGYVEGKNIHVEFHVPRKPEDVAEMAADLVNRKVDVIATIGSLRATDTIPIVIIACDRADRLVASIARPGMMTPGVGPVVAPKRSTSPRATSTL